MTKNISSPSLQLTLGCCWYLGDKVAAREALESGAYYQIFEGNALAYESLSLTTNFT